MAEVELGEVDLAPESASTDEDAAWQPWSEPAVETPIPARRPHRWVAPTLAVLGLVAGALIAVALFGWARGLIADIGDGRADSADPASREQERSDPFAGLEASAGETSFAGMEIARVVEVPPGHAFARVTITVRNPGARDIAVPYREAVPAVFLAPDEEPLAVPDADVDRVGDDLVLTWRKPVRSGAESVLRYTVALTEVPVGEGTVAGWVAAITEANDALDRSIPAVRRGASGEDDRPAGTTDADPADATAQDALDATTTAAPATSTTETDVTVLTTQAPTTEVSTTTIDPTTTSDSTTTTETTSGGEAGVATTVAGDATSTSSSSTTSTSTSTTVPSRLGGLSIIVSGPSRLDSGDYREFDIGSSGAAGGSWTLDGVADGPVGGSWLPGQDLWVQMTERGSFTLTVTAEDGSGARVADSHEFTIE